MYLCEGRDGESVAKMGSLALAYVRPLRIPTFSHEFVRTAYAPLLLPFERPVVSPAPSPSPRCAGALVARHHHRAHDHLLLHEHCTAHAAAAPAGARGGARRKGGPTGGGRERGRGRAAEQGACLLASLSERCASELERRRVQSAGPWRGGPRGAEARVGRVWRGRVACAVAWPRRGAHQPERRLIRASLAVATASAS